MSCVSKVSTLAILLFLGACSSNPAAPDLVNRASAPASTHLVRDSLHETTLLVNLEDGSVIKQTINIIADVCFKQISSSETTCFTQGDAIIDPETNTILGYEMIEDHINLIARYY